MARPVYSVPFLLGTPSTPIHQFAVPEDMTAVIRQISYLITLSSGTVTTTIQLSSIDPEIAIDQYAGAAESLSRHVEGRWVVPGGGFINIDASYVGLGLYWYVGGYLLEGNPS